MNSDRYREQIVDAIESSIRRAYEFSTPVDDEGWRQDAESIAASVLVVVGGERYLTREEVAERLGLGMTSLDELVKNGMPSHDWGLRTRKFLWSEVHAWLNEREARFTGAPTDTTP